MYKKTADDQRQQQRALMISFMVAIDCPSYKYRINEKKAGIFLPAVLVIRTGYPKSSFCQMSMTKV